MYLWCKFRKNRTKNKVWPRFDPIGPITGPKWGQKIKISKIRVSILSRWAKMYLWCEFRKNRTKNKIWPHWPHLGVKRGSKWGQKMGFFKIWSLILSRRAKTSLWCEFRKNRFTGTQKVAIGGVLELGFAFPFLHPNKHAQRISGYSAKWF